MQFLSSTPLSLVEQFVGDLGKFLTTSFTREAIYRPAALTQDLQGFVHLSDIDSMLGLPGLPASYVRLSKSGRNVPVESYRKPTDNAGVGAEVVDIARVAHHFVSGATIVVSNLEHFIPGMRSLSESFRSIFSGATECVFFATPAGRDGLMPHCDPVDVFVVQVDGRKSWQVWQPPADRSHVARTYKLAALGKPALEVMLEPGDVLYLPVGAPHAAKALEEASVHHTITVEPVTWRNLLQLAVDDVLRAEEFSVIAGSGEVPAEGHITNMIELLKAKLLQLDLTSSNHPHAPNDSTVTWNRSPQHFAALARADRIEGISLLVRTDAAIEYDEVSSSVARLTIRGLRLEVSTAVSQAIRSMAAGETASASAIVEALPPASGIIVIRNLVRAGIFDTEPEQLPRRDGASAGSWQAGLLTRAG
jgi:hypothetical protein